MTINVFEGARRIAKLVAVLWIVGVSTFASFQSDPYISVTYTVSSPNSPLVLSDPSCVYGNNVREDFTIKTKKGVVAQATACYKGFDLKTAKPVPPDFVLDKPSNSKREDEELQELKLRALRAAALRVAINSFVPSQADEREIDSRWWRERWRQIREAALWLVAGWAFLWGLTWTIGWVVRGFLGIPRGKDRQE